MLVNILKENVLEMSGVSEDDNIFLFVYNSIFYKRTDLRQEGLFEKMMLTLKGRADCYAQWDRI